MTLEDLRDAWCKLKGNIHRFSVLLLLLLLFSHIN